MKNQNHTSHRALHTSQNGITLIALIITIIVMLILVGVTINVALNGGLFTKASEASKQMQIEAEKEELLSSVVAAIGYDGKVDLEDIELPTGWTGTNGTYTSPKGNIYAVDENGKITEGGSNSGENETTPSDTIIGVFGSAEAGFEFKEDGSVILLMGETTYAGQHDKILKKITFPEKESAPNFWTYDYDVIKDENNEIINEVLVADTPNPEDETYINRFVATTDGSTGLTTLDGKQFDDVASDEYITFESGIITEYADRTYIEQYIVFGNRIYYMDTENIFMPSNFIINENGDTITNEDTKQEYRESNK